MNRWRTALGIVAVGGLIACSVALASGDPARQRTIALTDVAATIDQFIDESPTGPSPGDTEVFRDRLVYADSRRDAGVADGRCTLIDASTAGFECAIVIVLAQGTITTEGVATLVPGAKSTGAVTGGTGIYEGAGGHGVLEYHPGGGADSPVTITLTGV